jgi:hypothetical protein
MLWWNTQSGTHSLDSSAAWVTTALSGSLMRPVFKRANRIFAVGELPSKLWHCIFICVTMASAVNFSISVVLIKPFRPRPQRLEPNLGLPSSLDIIVYPYKMAIFSHFHTMSFQKTPVLPRICTGSARAMYIGPGLALAPHINVATTVAVSLSHEFSLRTWCRKKGWSDWQKSSVAIIPSETLHHLISTGPMAFLYLDPLGDGRLPLSMEKLEMGRLRLIEQYASIGIQAAFEGFGLHERKPVDARIGLGID